MSGGYVEASIEDSKSGARISVIQEPRKPTRIVRFDNWVEQEACSDFLADIIVRGIRSLEEERAEVQRKGLQCRDDGDDSEDFDPTVRYQRGEYETFPPDPDYLD